MIRPPSIEDVDAIARIHVESWRDTYRGIVPDAHLDALSQERRAAEWRKALASATDGTLVASEGAVGGVIGWISFGRSRDSDTTGYGEIHALYMALAHRGRGHGHGLMCAAEKRLAAQGFPVAILWVLALNVRARAFYARSGYAEDGASKTLTIEGRDLLELRYGKRLSETI